MKKIKFRKNFIGGNEYVGYRWKKGYFMISNFQNCCETWGWDIYGRKRNTDDNFTEMNDITPINDVISIDYCIRFEDNNYFNKINKNYSCGDFSEIEVMTQDYQYRIVLWCDHNGYYSHNVIFKNGKTEIIERL